MDEFPFNDDDVISINPEHSGNQDKLLKMSWFRDSVKRSLGPIASSWFGEGVPYEVLRIGGNWEKGRVRLRLEFVPDEPDETA
jgi:hypothetical protein